MRPVSILCSISICPYLTSSSSTSGWAGASGLRSEVGLGLEVVVGKMKFLACMDFLLEGAGGSL
jgi:hypothetical protein